MATWAIGDLQGCAEEFFTLLDRIRFGAGDRLWLLGDLVNRGPGSLATLRRVYELRDQVQVVLGNHDLHLLAIAFGGHRAGRSDTFDALLAAPDRDNLLHWLRAQPLMVSDRALGYAMVHAGVLPQWSLADAQARADEVAAALTGVHYQDYLRDLYGNEPATWDPALSGMARLRFITNAFTRMRLLLPDGSLEFAHKGALADAPAGLVPWYAVLPPATLAPIRLLFGHWAALNGDSGRDDVIALDTGCVWGRALTALCLESGDRVSVAASNDRG
ncbi:MAG: symmetrical bis(5'-nucleosyl)-tetraphosphatase [Pseudomonadota bacterium]